VGKLTYDSTMTVDFDDRVLTHLQAVISAKLRRGESFQFTWKDDPSIGGGRTTIWLNPSLPLSFRFAESKASSLNPAWIDALMRTANSTSGLQVVPEPANEPATHEVAHRTPLGHRFADTPEEPRRSPSRAASARATAGRGA
jgi:hypothetical protein